MASNASMMASRRVDSNGMVIAAKILAGRPKDLVPTFEAIARMPV